MKLHSYKFGLAAALTTLIVSVVITLLILILPDLANIASGGSTVMHNGNMSWSLNLMEYLKGLFFWSICVGLAVWLFAVLYNHL